MFENLIDDAAMHLAAGLTLSVIDFATSLVSNQSVDKVLAKKNCLSAMDIILEQNSPERKETSAPSEEADYAVAIVTVREYLLKSGLLKNRVNFITFIKNFIAFEKINTLTTTQKFGVALGLEVIYDTLFGFHYYTVVMKQSPLAALASNLYQIPAFFAGLLLGAKLLKIYKWFAISTDEKNLDNTISELIKNTPLMKYVQDFTPSPEAAAKLKEQGLDNIQTEFTVAGKKIFTGLQNLADRTRHAMEGLVNYKKNNEAQLRDEAEARKKRFDELTNGR